MSLSEDILKELESFAREKKVRRYRDYVSASLFSKAENYNAIEQRIEEKLGKLSGEGEVIAIKIDSGKVIDTGKESFLILRGRVFEYYQYKEMVSLFLRLYHIKDRVTEKEWIALYIDENPSTPWWSEER